MSPRPSIPRPTRGSALLAALCFATVLALALGSYAALCYMTLKTSNRAALSARSIQLAETGLEEALWALNNNTTAANWTATGWDPPAGGNETKLLSGFTYENGISGQIKLTITNYAGAPGTPTTIVATGTTTSNDGVISRALQSTAIRSALFANAISATTGSVVFNSSGVKADSYDSSVGDYDPNNAANIGYSAIIASGSTSILNPPAQLNDAQVSGYVISSAGALPDTTSATIKGKAAYNNGNVDPSQVISLPSSYASLPNSYPTLFAEPASPVTGYDTDPLPATLGDSSAPNTATPKLYKVNSDFTLAGTDTYTVVGPVTLFVPGDFSISGSAKIILSGTGSLALHVAGNIVIDGGGIENQTKKPKNLGIFDSAGDPNNPKSIEIGTTTPLYGAIYTPNMNMEVNNLPKIFGSIVANSVSFNSAPEIHYDLSLRNPTTYPAEAAFAGIVAPYTVTSWTEITPP